MRCIRDSVLKGVISLAREYNVVYLQTRACVYGLYGPKRPLIITLYVNMEGNLSEECFESV